MVILMLFIYDTLKNVYCLHTLSDSSADLINET